MSFTEAMWAGLSRGTISTSVLVANSTGLATIPVAHSAAGCLGLAAANTSAGAPCSMSASSAPDPPNVYLAFGSICGRTLLSEAAASTVARPTEEPGVAPAPCDAAGLDVVLLLLLLLLPHAASPTAAAIVSRPLNIRRVPKHRPLLTSSALSS